MWIAFSLLCCKQISIEHRISTIHKLTGSAIALFLTSKALRTTQSSKMQKDYHHAKVKWDFITGFKETERRRNGVAKILGSEEYFTQKNEIYRCFLCVCVSRRWIPTMESFSCREDKKKRQQHLHWWERPELQFSTRGFSSFVLFLLFFLCVFWHLSSPLKK